MGTSWYIGSSKDELIKVDVYYTDKFIRTRIAEGGIRMASMEDIIAMKLELIGNGRRKKDFWDLHALREAYAVSTMISFYMERNPYGHTEQEILEGLVNFTKADEEPDPICLLDKHWEFIKLDFVNLLKE